MSQVFALFSIPPGKLFFRWTWTSILLSQNWVSWISPNNWRDTVSKWTQWLLKEADNLERSLYCACWGCYPWISGEGAIWSRKCQSWKDSPVQWAQLSTDNVNFCTRSHPYQREAFWPSGLGRFFLTEKVSFPALGQPKLCQLLQGNLNTWTLRNVTKEIYHTKTKTLFTNVKEKILAHRASSKATRLFLTK